MTIAKPKHLEARRLMLDHLDMHPGQAVHNDLDPLEAGIVGDTSHAEGGDSYHLGEDQIRARGTRNRYSVDESRRDLEGLDEHASGVDYGWFAVTVNGRTWTLFDYNEWLIGLCKAGDPDTRDLREVIYTPDGRTVRRWDDLGIRSSGDSSHTTHTHHSEYRDADGHRMLNLARRFLTHIGLITPEDDMSWTDDVITNPSWRTDSKTNPTVQAKFALGDTWNQARAAAVDARAARLTAEATLKAVQGVNDEGILARVNEVAEELEKIPAATADALVDASRSPEDTAAALRAVLGDRAEAVGRILAGVTT